MREEWTSDGDHPSVDGYQRLAEVAFREIVRNLVREEHFQGAVVVVAALALDEVLPWGGWPEAALTELLLPVDGIGELHLLLPTLARLTQASQDIAVVAPPYLPYPAGWRQGGVDFAHVHLIDANARDALWASEQCLRAGCLAAVLCWPGHADDRALRRLQVAADTGGVMGFAFRDLKVARNPSPAALRIAIETAPAQLRVLKCRGGLAPARAIAFPIHAPAAA